jgi:Ca-activated chloride channel family protein
MRLAFFFILIWAAAFGCVAAGVTPSLTVVTDRDFYGADVENEIYVESRIDVPVTPGANPVLIRNIVFVIDRSGSMTGRRIELLRAAISKAVPLLAPRDFVSAVAFGSEVETVLPAKSCGQIDGIDNILDKIEPSGGSALFDALNQAAAQLRRNASPLSVNAIILATDGPATKGPRETEDFRLLADSLSREGITISTIGIGPDFDEDMLALLARMGNGRFSYALTPEMLPDLVSSAVGRVCGVVAKDARLTIESSRAAKKIETPDWTVSEAAERSISFRVQYLYAGENPKILASISAQARMNSYQLGTVRLAWTDPLDGASHQIEAPIDIRLERSSDALRDSLDPAVARTLADAIARCGMQDAITQMDKGNSGSAIRCLRNAVSELNNLNFKLDDVIISEKTKALKDYVKDLQVRELGAPDRKMLRSGLLGKFGVPTIDDASKP